MQRVFFALLLGYTLVGAKVGVAQDLQKKMDVAYAALKSLQPFLVSAERFQEVESEEKIIALLKSLNENFHSIDALQSPYSADPGFRANVSLVHALLDDSLARFKEGKKPYVLWRLRTVTNNCIACHSTYNVALSFSDADLSLKDISDRERGEFYLATRQFDKAIEAFLLAFAKERSAFERMIALRKWLTVEIRIKGDPKSALGTLQRLVGVKSLPDDDRNEIEHWQGSLNAWMAEGGHIEPSLDNAERLIRSSMLIDSQLTNTVDTVALLRASGFLHRVLSQINSDPQVRRKALLLLGFSYAKLPSYFINELPEVYFKQCIDEFPGSAEAKRAYGFLKERTVVEFTGSSGTHLPGDVADELAKYYRKAYGIPTLEGRI